jgi:predicted glutamine amidotransferase
MTAFVAAFGRFKMEELTAAAAALLTAPAQADPLAGGWGAAWCHGNRLESARSNRPHGTDPEFAKLHDLRTDMAAVLLHDPSTRLGPREVQPFVRREQGRMQTFFHVGHIARPEQLRAGARLPDGPNPSERYFLHVLAGLDSRDPIASVRAALSSLAGEPTLSFMLMSNEGALVACSGDAARSSEEPQLFLGHAELLRVIAPQPVSPFEHMRWEPLSSGTVISLSRERWNLP